MRAMPVKLVLFASLGFTLANADPKQAQPAPGPAAGWVYIGTTHAKHFNDHDKVMVHGPNNHFQALKIRVKDASLHMQKLVVTYGNGLKDDVPVNYKIPKGGESRPIPMKYGKREVVQIDFWYDTKGWLNGSADVSIYGRH